MQPDLPLLSLGQPGLRALFADPDSDQAQAVATLLHQPRHALAHPEAARLFAELQGVGVHEMPVLSWPSRMHHASTAFLAYMDGSWWEKVGDEIELDDRITGHPVVAEALATAGYTWSAPLATQATVSPPDAGQPE